MLFFASLLQGAGEHPRRLGAHDPQLGQVRNALRQVVDVSRHALHTVLHADKACLKLYHPEP
eukprot:1740515-Prorocentrum_lima.AAC.1